MTGALPYLLTFAVSAFGFWLAGKCRGSLRIILTAAALLLPCLLGGFRDVTVGTDVGVYGVYAYEGALSRSLPDYISAFSGTHSIGFLVYGWVAARLGRSLWFYLAAIQLVTDGFVALALRKLAPRGLWAGMLAFYLLLFPTSLNAMKQMMAVAVVCYALTFCLERRPAPFLAWMALAVLFHQTAIVALCFYPLCRVYMEAHREGAFFGRAQGFVFGVGVVVVLGAAFVLGDRIVELVAPLKDSYSYQLNAPPGEVNKAGLALLSWSAVVLVLAKFGAAGGSGGAGEESERSFFLLGILFLTGCVLLQFNLVAVSLMRFAYYGTVFAPVLAARLLEPGSTSLRRAAGWLTLLVLAVYFSVAYVLNGGEAVVPYTSAILGL